LFLISNPTPKAKLKIAASQPPQPKTKKHQQQSCYVFFCFRLNPRHLAAIFSPAAGAKKTSAKGYVFFLPLLSSQPSPLKFV